MYVSIHIANLHKCILALSNLFIYIYKYIYGGARGVMVIIVGNGHGDMSSNPGWDWLHFT